ncbi:MAG: hypothetical protein ACE366_07425 [Bradymonadia bacterium]
MSPERLSEDQEARLTDLLDGALDDASQAEMTALLQSAPDQQEALDDARAAMQLLQHLPAHAPSPDFARKVRRRVRRTNVHRGYEPATDLLGFKLGVEVFTVIAAAVLAAFYIFGETTRQMPGPLKSVSAAPTQTAPGDAAPTGATIKTPTKATP